MSNKNFIQHLLITAIMYFSFAFVKMGFSPSNWSEDNRFTFIYITILLNVFLYGINEINKWYQQEIKNIRR